MASASGISWPHAECGFRRQTSSLKSMPAFRADRLASLYFFHPLRRLRRRVSGIPILMYHSISDFDVRTGHPYYGTVTAPGVFDRHLKQLHEKGYKTISLNEAVRRLHSPQTDTGNAVVITFDDGFRDFYSNAFPILCKYRYSATVFLPTAYIDREARKFKDITCLTWGEVRELQKAGIDFGSHTVTHPQLRNLDTKGIEEEVRCSKEKIEEELGCPTSSFSYPYAFPETDGDFTRRLQSILAECGYGNGVSTVIGTADRAANIFFLKRLPMNSHDDPHLFEAKIEGGYDWLRALQYASKLRTK